MPLKNGIAACRLRGALVATAKEKIEAGKSAFNAVESFEPLFFNNLVVVLDRFFVHRSRTMEGKDGNRLNEVRIMCDSILENRGVMSANKTIKYCPEKSILKLQIGEEIKLTESNFIRLFKAFFAESESCVAKRMAADWAMSVACVAPEGHTGRCSDMPFLMHLEKAKPKVADKIVRDSFNTRGASWGKALDGTQKRRNRQPRWTVKLGEVFYPGHHQTYANCLVVAAELALRAYKMVGAPVCPPNIAQLLPRIPSHTPGCAQSASCRWSSLSLILQCRAKRRLILTISIRVFVELTDSVCGISGNLKIVYVGCPHEWYVPRSVSV